MRPRRDHEPNHTNNMRDVKELVVTAADGLDAQDDEQREKDVCRDRPAEPRDLQHNGPHTRLRLLVVGDLHRPEYRVHRRVHPEQAAAPVVHHRERVHRVAPKHRKRHQRERRLLERKQDHEWRERVAKVTKAVAERPKRLVRQPGGWPLEHDALVRPAAPLRRVGAPGQRARVRVEVVGANKRQQQQRQHRDAPDDRGADVHGTEAAQRHARHQRRHDREAQACPQHAQHRALHQPGHVYGAQHEPHRREHDPKDIHVPL